MQADGAGFCYYKNRDKNGRQRVAAMVRKIKAHQSHFLFYDNDARSTLICSVDESTTGFAQERSGRKMLCTKDGVKVQDEQGWITAQWKWDPRRQNPGTPPN